MIVNWHNSKSLRAVLNPIMANFQLIAFSLLSLFSLYSTVQCSNEMRTYIVHVSPPSSMLTDSALSISEPREAWYKSFLPPATASDNVVDDSRMVYSYHSVVSGFAAKLTDSDLASMRAKSGFINAYLEKMYTIQTTRSPAFLGLDQNVEGNFWNKSGLGRGVIIGVLDTGILPSHPSFSGEGMPPPPAKWKGRCEFSSNSTESCNNKLIGARVFVRGARGNRTSGGSVPDTPIDVVGHGTHTSSTAAGRFVENASALGSAFGTAVGMAPFAHLAMYRVCLDERCAESDILAGLDAAVADGVDVISISVGGAEFSPFYENAIAVGAFGAIEKGVFVSCSAGNSGPKERSVSNDAPWIMTVGASTMDRAIRTTVKLGNGEELNGESLFQSNESASMLPLIYPGSVNANAAFCNNGSLDGIEVKGKVVVCDSGGGIARTAKGAVVKSAGASAMILANSPDKGFSIQAEAHKLPASLVTFSDASNIKAYINIASSSATATIIPKGTVIGGAPAAPAVAAFSSRGPSLVSKGILKPDIIGPGVDVLAAWPLLPIGPSPVGSPFNVLSGTSMSTPHLSGIAALLKSAHPDWSPAMIRSAIMTTAETSDNAGQDIADHTLAPASLFAVGAGHVSPAKANRPGLVYDIKADEYIGYMCGNALNDMQLSTIARREINCSNVQKIVDAELNYPSFSVTLGPLNNFTRVVTRTAMNAGESKSSYSVQIVQPLGVSVRVTPEKLDFGKAYEKRTYSVEFTVSDEDVIGARYSEGSVSWVSSDTSVKVRSPVLIAFQ